ncbi:myotubularin-related protein 11 [Sceloporus undulatus]|uniref:myotubularin-related protein 11 n=1 Tax=Sceloporus undulatus TaxID=8520 RepID=UPI001C4B1762|nr:myotubularin-related protein 11 [Sceloporus undulatus]
MLSMSKNSFKIKQPSQDPGPQSPKSSNMTSKRNQNDYALQCIPGEYIQEEAARVRKSLSSRDGDGYIPGTLYCTNLRVAFLPDLSPDSEDYSCHSFMHSDYDVALSCIGRLVAVNSFTKAKVLTSTSTLKFIPEELVVYCRDFRVLHFHFHESGLEPQAFRVTMAIAQAQESSSRDAGASGCENVALKNLENSRLRREEEEEAEEESPTLLFETLSDWEKELKRLGVAGWRVSPVNERFDMSTSLPKYLWVPSQFLDNELKRTFVHFNERRIPRLCWHHPAGSSLLRSASFHPDSDPEKEDMRSVERLMLAGHSQCVVVDVTSDLPSPPEIQQSYSRLWMLSLCLADSSVAPSDEKWLSSLEGTRWLDHVRACLKKASEVSLLLAERSRSVVLQESDDRDLNCLLASLVQVLSDPHTRTISGFQSLIQKEWVAAGHPFLQRLNLLQRNDRDESPVFLLFLDCIWQLLQQFPKSFEFTDAYLVALHDSSYVPFSSTFLFNCQWERGRKNQNRFRNQLYTPMNGWRETVCMEILQKGGYLVKEAEPTAYLPTIWDWALRYSPRQRAQFRNPWFCNKITSSGEALNGNFLPPNGSKMDNTPSGKWALYLFSKGSLTLQSHFFPWKNGSLSKKGSRRTLLPEGPGEQERSLRGNSLSVRLLGCDDELLLLPSHAGPSVRLWKRCYLRGNPDIQVGLFASTIAGLMEELDLLEEQLLASKKKLQHSC